MRKRTVLLGFVLLSVGGMQATAAQTDSESAMRNRDLGTWARDRDDLFQELQRRTRMHKVDRAVAHAVQPVRAGLDICVRRNGVRQCPMRAD